MSHRIIKCCALIVVMCNLLSSCKNAGDGKETSDTAIDTSAVTQSEITQESKEDPFDGTYALEVLAEDGSMPQQGRIYLDPSYYREDGGQKYIAVNESTGQIVIDDAPGLLSEGEQFRVDRDLTITFDKPEYIAEWDDPSCPEAGLTIEGTTFYRNKGKVRLSKEYCFVHPSRIVYADGTVNAESDPDKWVLCRYDGGFDDGGTPNAVTSYDSCKWVRVSDDCKVIFVVENSEQPAQSINDLYALMEQYAEDDQKYYMAGLVYRGDSVAKITIVVE